MLIITPLFLGTPHIPSRAVSTETPDKVATSPMDLSTIKKESPNSQPVDLSMGSKSTNESRAVDLSVNSNCQSQKPKQESETANRDEDDKNPLEASRSLLRAALQAKQDAKQQHPKLMALLGDTTSAQAAAQKTIENLVAAQAGTPDLRPPFSPLLMAAQMNMAFPPVSLAGALPQFPGAPPLFGAPFSFAVKRKISADGQIQLSPMSSEDESAKLQKPAKRRKSMSHGYDSDGSKSPHSDGGSERPLIDGKFPSRVDGKRYICGLCGASFTFQTNLTRHQRKLHGKPYVRRPVPGAPRQSEAMGIKTEAIPENPQGPPVTYDVPPTPPIFGPVLGN